MTEPLTPPAAPSLQFDRAISTADAPSAPGVVCAGCKKSLTNSYFTLSQQPFCASCKSALEQNVASTRNPKTFAKAFGYGLAAAIAGAIIYYAVIALFELEIGIVAILIGYMVGFAIHKAVRGFGARRYQVLAAALTYFAVGMAYVPLALKAVGNNATGVAGDSTSVTARNNMPTAADSVAARADTSSASVKQIPFVLALGAASLFAFALPVMVILGSMPSGLISALIIGFGIRQAWKMTASPDLSFVGPLRVAPVADPPAAASA